MDSTVRMLLIVILVIVIIILAFSLISRFA